MPIIRRRLPSLNGLRAFAAAGRRLNFRLAADDLGVTQGAIAQHIRALELDMGVKLFDRLPKSVILTEIGASYLREVLRAFEILEDATSMARADNNHLTINVTPTFATKWLLPNLREFRQLHPGIEVSILATDQMPDFKTTAVDLAVRDARPPFPDNSQHEFMFRRELISVASPQWVERYGIPKTAADLATHVLLHDMENEWPMFLKKTFGIEHVGVAQNVSFNFATLAIDAAIAGEGLAMASLLLVQKDIEAGRLVQVFPELLRSSSDYYIVAPNRSKDRLATKVAWKWLVDVRNRSRTLDNGQAAEDIPSGC
jgi:LysR family glycine cleavage system transcriptional activator